VFVENTTYFSSFTKMYKGNLEKTEKKRLLSDEDKENEEKTKLK
jgi:hypothetical protein